MFSNCWIGHKKRYKSGKTGCAKIMSPKLCIGDFFMPILLIFINVDKILLKVFATCKKFVNLFTLCKLF